MMHLLCRKDEFFPQVCVYLIAKAGLALFGSFTFGFTIVLEEERGQQSGEKEGERE